jgi:hypothetical protein
MKDTTTSLLPICFLHSTHIKFTFSTTLSPSDCSKVHNGDEDIEGVGRGVLGSFWDNSCDEVRSKDSTEGEKFDGVSGRGGGRREDLYWFAEELESLCPSPLGEIKEDLGDRNGESAIKSFLPVGSCGVGFIMEGADAEWAREDDVGREGGEGKRDCICCDTFFLVRCAAAI